MEKPTERKCLHCGAPLPADEKTMFCSKPCDTAYTNLQGVRATGGCSTIIVIAAAILATLAYFLLL